MKHDVQQDIELRRYLLGELNLEEQVLVEQRLFLDSDYAELLQAVEDDLIDEYLADELTGTQREKFDNHFLLLPEHRADLRIAQALKEHLATQAHRSPAPGANNTSKDPSPTIPPFSFFSKPLVWLSLTFAALIVLAVIAWIAFRATRGPAAEAPQQAHEPQPANSRPDERQGPGPHINNDNRVETANKDNENGSDVNRNNSGKPPERRSVPALATVYAPLIAGNPSRSIGSIKRVRIYSYTKEVQFKLPLEFADSYENYRAELLRGDRKIDERTDLKSQPDDKDRDVLVVLVTFAADVFREQNYRIRLHAVPTDQQPAEPPVTYPFNVERK